VERLVVALLLIAVALLIAGYVQRRRPDAPTQARSVAIPQQLDRTDFSGESKEWLVVVFSSDTCAACETALARAQYLTSGDVHVQEVTWQGDSELHRRYAIDTVPLVAIAGSDGSVGAGFVGPPATSELTAAMSSLRRGIDGSDSGQ